MTQAELDAGTKAARDFINETGYGMWVRDQQCEDLARAIIGAAEHARHRKESK